MCNLYLDYYASENMFVDEYGEIVYDIFTVITPQDLFLFHKDPSKYNEFPMVGHPEITCLIAYEKGPTMAESLLPIYPCHDLPTSCGWGEDAKYNNVVTSGICTYPTCWCGKWLVSPKIQNKISKTEDHINCIVYRGESESLARTVWEHLNLIKNTVTLIPLANSMYRIKIHGVDLVQMDTTYQVDITGELV